MMAAGLVHAGVTVAALPQRQFAGLYDIPATAAGIHAPPEPTKPPEPLKTAIERTPEGYRVLLGGATILETRDQTDASAAAEKFSMLADAMAAPEPQPAKPSDFPSHLAGVQDSQGPIAKYAHSVGVGPTVGVHLAATTHLLAETAHRLLPGTANNDTPRNRLRSELMGALGEQSQDVCSKEWSIAQLTARARKNLLGR